MAKRIKLDTQSIMAVGVLVVSFMALFISVRQTSIMGEQTKLLVEQNKASAWPHVEIGHSRSFAGNEQDGYDITDFRIIVTNKGTGPAIVEGVRVTFDGKAARDWGEFYNLTNKPDSVVGGHSNSSVMNKVIASNEDITMLDLGNNPDLMTWIHGRGEKFAIEICYKSVYGDYWTVKREGFRTNLEQAKTEKVSGCSISAKEVFME